MRNGGYTNTFRHQVLRNIGLGVLNDPIDWAWACKYRRRQHRAEQKKIAVASSHRLAVSRCGVHILPILTSTAIIAVNLKQDFIGIDFRGPIQSETINIAFLQTAAKVQELLIVASLATIVFQLTRDELIYGDGLPLGMVGAGVDFSRLSFFWSREFVGSLRGLSRGPRRYRKAQLVIFLVVAGALSLLVGPSCAVLLVPQTQDWPIGGTPISLNGTFDSFWPVNLTVNSSQSEICLAPNGTLYGVCPNGGYESLWLHYSKLDNSTYADHVPSYAYDLSGNHYYWSMESMRPIMTRTISLNGPKLEVWTVQPHLSASIILDQLMKDWWQALMASGSYENSQIVDRQAATSYLPNPLVRVSCAPPSLLSSSNHTVQFPIDNTKRYQSHDISNSSVSNNPTNHLQFTWVHLNESFGPVTVGAVLQSAWNYDNQSRLVVGCSLSAHWAYTQLRSDSYSFWQGWYPKSVDFGDLYPTKGSSLNNGSLSTQDAIVVDESWLKALTPATPPSGPGYFDWKPTTIESILSATRITEDIENSGLISIDEWQAGNDNRPGLLASVMASIFADGLSRAGVEQMYKTQGSPSQWTLSPYLKKANFDKSILQDARSLDYPSDDDMFSVNFGISGLNYSVSLAQKLAMAVLFLHIALAAFHCVISVLHGKSSACWDSVTEIMVIAQNSKPAFKSLENTAAGIQYSATFSKKVVVRPTQLPDDQEADHLQFQLIEEQAVAEDEAVELETRNVQPTDSADSSIIEEAVSLLRPNTWPNFRSNSKTSFHRNSYVPHGGRSSSVPGRPSVTLLSHISGSSLQTKFKEDFAYG